MQESMSAIVTSQRPLLEDSSEELTRILDTAEKNLRREAPQAGGDLIAALDRLFTAASEQEKLELAGVCRAHRLHSLLLEDPYTARAFRKPRGYAGDAVMLDYVYDAKPPSGTSAPGQRIFAATTGCATARSVVYRREILAARIDAAARRRARPNVLALAAGHLREASRSRAIAERQIGQCWAIDQDPESLAVVERDYGALGVSTARASVRSLLKGRVPFEEIDLAYAAGLFDYLDDGTARALLRVLFGCLRPGGRLLVANFTRAHQAQGYMTWMMGWELIRRDASDLLALVQDQVTSTPSRVSAWVDVSGNVAYLELERSCRE